MRNPPGARRSVSHSADGLRPSKKPPPEGGFFDPLPGKKQNAGTHSRSDVLVRQKGLEPPTYWFVASYSIQLSYCRMSVSSQLTAFR